MLAIAQNSASPASAIAIGNPVTGGTAGDLLFVGPTGLLAQDNNLNWNATNGLAVARIVKQAQNADTASAINFTQPKNGNFTCLTGGASVTRISSTNLTDGTLIGFTCSSNTIFAHGTANSGTDIGLQLRDGFNYTLTSGQEIFFILATHPVIGQQWWEIARRSSLYVSPLIWSPNNTGTNAGRVLCDDTTGVTVAYGGSNILIVDATNFRFFGPTQFLSTLEATTGTSSLFARPGGILKTDTTSVGNTADTNEDNLITYSLAGGALGSNGQSIEVEAAGTYANNADTKRVRLYLGATVLFDTTAQGFVAGGWKIKASIIRTGAATQIACAEYFGDVTKVSNTVLYTTPTETLSGAITIKCTGQAGAANANDIVQQYLKVKFMPLHT